MNHIHYNNSTKTNQKIFIFSKQKNKTLSQLLRKKFN